MMTWQTNLQVWFRILSSPSSHQKLHLGHDKESSYPASSLRLRHRPPPEITSDPETLEALVEDALRPEEDDGVRDEAAASKLVSQYEAQPHEHAYVALCSIFKNEHGNLREWVDYHR